MPKPARLSFLTSRRLLVPLLCLPLVAIAQSPLASKDARITALLGELGRLRTPNTVSISPDGGTLAWTFTGSSGSELHLTQLAPDGSAHMGTPDRLLSPDTVGNPTNTTPGLCPASHPAWSPDGTQLAFLSGCSGNPGSWQSSSQDNIFVWSPASSNIKQVSNLRGSISDIQWSPDGKSVAFLFVENATRRAGALDAMKPWNGVYGEDGVEVQRVYLAPLNSGKGHFVTDPNLHAYEFAFGPSPTRGSDSWYSEQIAFIAAPPPGENNWWVARMYMQLIEERSCEPSDMGCQTAVPMDTRTKTLFDPTTTPGPLHGLQIAVPRFSPDGKSIAFIGGLMSDQGATGGDIYLIPSTALKPNESPKDITPNRPASPAWITWLGPHSLGVTEHVGGSSHLTVLELHTAPDGAVTTTDDPNFSLTLPESIVAGFDTMSVSTSKTDNIALIRQSFDHPPEVWAGPLNHLQQISHLNDSLKPSWGRAESIDYTNEGFPIQGWLLYPANYDPSKKYPLIVSVHGGPSSAATPRWPTDAYGSVPFSALGYFDFMPNPRGSFGQGEKFTQANIKDFGYGDLRDILAGVDILEKRFPIDKDREGITGWSYGGFMTMFAVTQTTRFRAAVAGAGIANYQSYYGENSIDRWMIPFFGASVYDDPAVYAKSSPITFIKRVKTPTLVVVGDRDGECPAPQSFEFWHALRDEGIKTQLVIYPNEGHHFVDPDHQRDVLRRALDWFETQMPAK